jgi:hypothetical protein
MGTLSLGKLSDEQSRVLGQRRDTPGNENWSGRWESKISRGIQESLQIKVLHASLSTACDYCVENTVIPANTSQCGPWR